MSGTTYLAARLQIEDDLRHDDRLTPLAFKVAIELIRRRHTGTGQCNVSIPKIAEALRCGARSVDRALVSLVANGWIKRTSGKGRSTNSYAFPRLEITPAQGDDPGSKKETSSRLNGATTDVLSRTDDATTFESGDLLSRHFDNVVAPFSTSLSRQNGAQSLLENSLTDLAPKPPADVVDPASAAAVRSKSSSVASKPPRSKPPGGADARKAFDRFWQAWPHRVGKPAAVKAFAKHAGEIDAILAGVERYIREKPSDRQWLNPATFLNQERWTDRPAPMHGARRPLSPASPDDPEIEFPGGVKRRTSRVRRAISAFAARPNDWPPEMGPPPGTPGCRVPKHLLLEATSS